MNRPCKEIHPILQPETCPTCAQYVASIASGPGRVRRVPAKLFGDAPEDKKECPEPLGGDETTFLEPPEKLIPCKDGSGSDCSGSGSGVSGDCKGGGDCGVSGVYCQGNMLMVMYTTPVTPPPGNIYCTKVTWSLNCEAYPENTYYCKEWKTGFKYPDKRTILCPGGYGVLEEQIWTENAYTTMAECEAACGGGGNTSTTTTPPP